MFEYTTRVGISKVTDDVVKLTTEKVVPVQMLFCLKETNAKKSILIVGVSKPLDKF